MRSWMRLAPAVVKSRPRTSDVSGDVGARLSALLRCRWVWWAPDIRTAWAAVVDACEIGSAHRVHIPIGIAADVRDLIARSGATVVDVDLHEDHGTPLWPDPAHGGEIFVLDHRFGLPSPLPRDAAIILEDTTAALGGALDGRPVGSLGVASVLALGGHPFSRSKGAILATNTASCAEQLQHTRGITAPKPEHAGDLIGDVEALDDWNEGCRAAAGVYNSVWRGLNGVPIRPVLPSTETMPTYSAYLVRVPDPSALVLDLQREGIEARRPLDGGIWQLLDSPDNGKMPGARAFYRSALQLPNHPDLDLHELLHAADVVRQLVTAIGTCSRTSSVYQNCTVLPDASHPRPAVRRRRCGA